MYRTYTLRRPQNLTNSASQLGCNGKDFVQFCVLFRKPQLLRSLKKHNNSNYLLTKFRIISRRVLVFFSQRKYLDTMGEKLQVISQNLQRPSWQVTSKKRETASFFASKFHELTELTSHVRYGPTNGVKFYLNELFIPFS